MSRRYIQPHELLEVADSLAGRGAGPGKPKTIALRRAISTAYYALFHKLSQHTVERLMGPGWSDNHAAVARWIAHTDLAKLSIAANGQGSGALRMALEPVAPDVADVAQAFVDLQDARHGADYDDLFDVTKSMTLSYVDTAKDSVARADALFEAEDQSYLRFLGLAVGGVKVAKAR